MAEETNAMISLDELGITEKLEESTELASLTKTSDYLPQLRVYGSEANIVKEGKFPMGHFGLYFSKDKIIDMDEQFNLLVVNFRPRATIVTGDAPVSFYDMKSKGFQMIKQSANAKMEGYLYGLEYLIWIPQYKNFGLFLMGNPTLRRESEKVKAFTERACTLKIKLIKGKKHTWHGCEVFQCSTPFDAPSKEDLIKQLQGFKNPVESTVDFVGEEKDASGREV